MSKARYFGKSRLSGRELPVIAQSPGFPERWSE